MESLAITREPELLGWFTEKILEARKLREKHDIFFDDDAEEVMYLAGLLTHMAQAPWLALVDARGERLDMDVASRTDKERSLRERQATYQTTAERYLLHLGLWDGLQGNQRGRFYQITESNLADRASGYYAIASDLSARLPRPLCQKQTLLRHMADHLGMWMGILMTLRGDVLNLLPVVSTGQEFHLAHGSFG
ncbi:MAG: hypothetical protein RL318_2827 [Fibrobacterota bacterium]|jgi:hypothetical protein